MKAVRIILGLPSQTSCKNYFIQLSLLTVPSLLILEAVCYIKKPNITPSFVNHRYNTRKKGIHAEQHRLTLYEHKPKYCGLKLLQALPEKLRKIKEFFTFKSETMNFLLENEFYDLNSYLSK
jgi:hypothetical protein